MRLSWLLLAGMTVQALAGLLLDPYRDIAWIALGWRGNDAVTLLVACPLLAWALAGAHRGSPRGQLVHLGLLGFALYNYAFYMLGAALNALFPLYVALFVLAVSALVRVLPAPSGDGIARALAPHAPVRFTGGFLASVAVGLALVWLVMWARHVFAGQPAPGGPEVFRVVAALDLGFMVPSLATGGVLLWRRRAAGVVLATAAGIQAALYLIVLTTNSALLIARGLATWPGELPVWAPLGLATSAVMLNWLRCVPRADEAA
ncbi:MAG: hypothetical protein NW201_06645 [Gemmatimonadales bacterium]|nr:hypothetical protein [Gemmatimonadales bacterium]